MKKKCKILFIIASLALTLSLMSNTYSRYVANTTGNLDMLFANWQILVNENDILDETSSSIQITPVILENEHISQNKVAPSTQGYFDINIDPTNVDVSFDYQIDIEVLNENLPDLMITKYAILDSDYTEGDEIITNTLENNRLNGSLIYQNDIEDYSFEPFTIRIYFEWYDGNDGIMDDTADSEIGRDAAANDTTLQIAATIQFEQQLEETENI